MKNFNNNGGELTVRPGEQFNLDFTLENVSPIATVGGTVVVESADQGIEVINGAAVVPAVSGNAQVKLSGIVLKASSSVVHEKTANVVLRWTSDEGESYTSQAKVRLVKSELSIVGVDFGDADHPADNGFEPGGQGTLYVTVKNNGSFPVINGILEARSLSPQFIASAQLLVPFLAVGESIRIETPIDIELYEGTVNDQVLPFVLIGSSQSTFGEEVLEAESSFVVGKYGFREVEFNQIGMTIPDMSTVNYDFSGIEGIKSIKDLTVHVKIEHSYVGDVTITLFHPNGASVVLRKNVGGSNDNVDEEYGPASLDAFDGLPTEGVWRLQLNDSSKSDQGILTDLKIRVKGFI